MSKCTCKQRVVLIGDLSANSRAHVSQFSAILEECTLIAPTGGAFGVLLGLQMASVMSTIN
jgi:hypothetical protein